MITVHANSSGFQPLIWTVQCVALLAGTEGKAALELDIFTLLGPVDLGCQMKMAVQEASNMLCPKDGNEAPIHVKKRD